MKQLLESIGLTSNQEVDKETLSFIYDFVEKNGGIDAVKKEMNQKQHPPTPPQCKYRVGTGCLIIVCLCMCVCIRSS